MARRPLAPRRPRATLAAAVALLGVALVGVACATATTGPPGTAPGTTPGSGPGTTAGTVVGDNPAFSAFYQPPSPLPPAAPGTIIRSQPLTGTPAGSQGWLVLYHSTGLDGSDIAVSGTVIAPTAPAPPGGRPVVSWAHPTTGVADTCAPSAIPDGLALIAGLQDFLSAGYVVAATDYQGLGTPGVHPYLVGISEGRGVLDAARAARNLDGTGAGSKLLLWGHSQGGQASLFAGQLASTYAPELSLVGTAAAAPAGELAELLTDDKDTLEGVALGAYALNAYAAIYGPTTPGLDLAALLTPAGSAAVPQIVGLCIVVPTQYEQLTTIGNSLVGNFYTTNPATLAPWTGLLAQNTPGQARTGAPIFIAQGTADQVVIPSTTQQLVTAMCGDGDPIELKSYTGVTHSLIGYTSAPDVAAWMQSLVAGQPAPSTC